MPGAAVNYGYDDIGEVVSAVGYEPGGGTLRANENFGYAYDGARNLLQRSNNTLIQTFSNDNADELVNVSRNNNLLTVAGGLSNAPTTLAVNGQSAAVYNDLSFAVGSGVALNNGLNTFTTIVTSSGVTVTNLLIQNLPATQNLTYDLNGNLTSDGLHGYVYDCANELTQVTLTNQWQVQYTYDGLGRRRIRTEYVWQGGQWLNANEVLYVYDGMRVLQERNLLNSPTVTYTRGLDLSGTQEGAGGIGGLLARTDVNGSTYYHTDGNGNVTMLVDGSGNVQARYLYDSFGNTLGMWGALAAVNPYRFSSKEIDWRTGQYYYGYRYYDPNLQRWLNQDPIGENGGINLYQFNQNSPINYVDPLGLTTVTSPDWFPGATDVNGNGDFTRVVNDGSDATAVLKRLTQDQLRQEEQRTADRLKNFENDWGQKDRRSEGSFDAKYFKGVCKDRDYYYVDGMDRIYADNEINYLGIGMYERWLGDSRLTADAITLAWKETQYPLAPIPSGTWYWLNRGYDDYPSMSSGSSGGSSGSSGGRR